MQRRRFLVTMTAAAVSPLSAFGQEAPIRLRDLYNRDLSFSDLALANEGARVTIAGFMAPPLKADSKFYVLTKMPMAVCPFCEPGQTWPDDILAVYERRVVDVIPFNVPILTRGILELGDYVDPEFGFYSKVRIVEAVTERA